MALTDNEREILNLVIAGKPNDVIPSFLADMRVDDNAARAEIAAYKAAELPRLQGALENVNAQAASITARLTLLNAK